MESSPVAIWATLGVIAIILELFTAGLLALFFGTGFLAAAACAYFIPDSFAFQLIFAGIGGIVGFYAFFKKMGTSSLLDKGVGQSNEYEGIVGVAKDPLDKYQKGYVELETPILGSKKWFATSDGEILPGMHIQVVSVGGDTLRVKEID